MEQEAQDTPTEPRYVIGPDGTALTLADLPDTATCRWVVRRKAQVVAAVRGGLLSIADACSRYGLSFDEFMSWQTTVERHGMSGLRVTRRIPRDDVTPTGMLAS